MRKKSVCVLASGGIDSSALMVDLLRQGLTVYPLYIRCGFRWEKAELYWLKRMLNEIKSPRLKALSIADFPMINLLRDHWSFSGRSTPKDVDPDSSVYLPGRNIVLLGQAGLFCAQRKIPKIALGTLKSNPFPDAAPRFLKALQKALSLGLDFKLEISTPYARIKKSELIRRAQGVPLDFIFSCLNPSGIKPCNRCNKCAERQAALAFRDR